MSKPHILDELRDLIPPLAKDEREQLEKNIIRDGCREPLSVWKTASCNILLDGHNRLEICERNGIKYRTKYVTGIESEDEAKTWLIDNQLGRRNLPRQAQTLLLGMKHERRKKKVPNPEGAGGKSGKIVKGQSDPQQTTAEAVAKEEGVHPNTVKNAAKLAQAAQTLNIVPAIISGKETRTNKEIMAAARRKHNNTPEPTEEEIQEQERIDRNVGRLVMLNRCMGVFNERCWDSWEAIIQSLVKPLGKSGVILDPKEIRSTQNFLGKLANHIETNQKEKAE